MARARYCVSLADYADRDEFMYTFYRLAPAFYLARNPTHEEKLAFANQLATRYNPRALNMKSFGCVGCGSYKIDVLSGSLMRSETLVAWLSTTHFFLSVKLPPAPGKRNLLWMYTSRARHINKGL